MYYGLILLTTVMFGASFALNGVYRKHEGDSLEDTLKFSIIGGVPGVILLLIFNDFKWEFTIFTFLLAVIKYVSGLLFSYCSLKALGKINLSLYSVISMLGGMFLPSLAGIMFFSEAVTAAKIVCFVFITGALLATFEKSDTKSSGAIYYIGVFILNGMSGVISKVFNAAPYEKTSAEAFSIMIALLSVVISAVMLIVISIKNKRGFKLSSVSLAAAASGLLNSLANYWLVIALTFVDASVQYPMVTGGVMIVSTVFSCLGGSKPSKKELLSVFLAFTGMLALFLIK